MLERPPQSYAHRLKLIEDTSPRDDDELATVQIKPDISTLPRYTSAESFFSCCDSVAALALANCNEVVYRSKYYRTRPHPAYFARRPKLERYEW
jgi:hypothetical protein